MSARLGWPGILRLGIVQAALGATVILATSTLNRVMVVEGALPAVVPALLVGLHYAVQIARPRLGHGSDVGGRRTPWIVGGLLVLALGTGVAAVGTALMAAHPLPGIAVAVAGFLVLGLGVGSAGTSLLVLLAASVDDGRRAAAATVVWIMMIAGFVLTAAVAGHLLDPYSPARLVAVTGGISVVAALAGCLAVVGLENGVAPRRPAAHGRNPPFRQALAEVWAEPQARRFTLFVFASMLAYSALNLLLEPFAGTVFGMTPGATARLAGLQHGGLLAGMVLVALGGTAAARRGIGSMRVWTFGGCLASALGVLGLAAAALVGPAWPLAPTVFLNGFANGTFAIGAIASMMQLVAQGRSSREGVRMGLWGGAQALAFGLGGLSGALASDVGRLFAASPGGAYAGAFAIQAALFVAAAYLASRVFETPEPARPSREILPAGLAAAITGP